MNAGMGGKRLVKSLIENDETQLRRGVISAIYVIQPESWLRIRKLEAQGPSNSSFTLQANLHDNRPRVLKILRAFLVMYSIQLHNLGRALNEVARWS